MIKTSFELPRKNETSNSDSNSNNNANSQKNAVNQTKKQNETITKDFVDEYVESLLKENSQPRLIEHLEKSIKNFNRCQSKPEAKKELFKDDDKLLIFLHKNPECLNSLIKFFTLKLNDLKLTANSTFTKEIEIKNSLNSNNSKNASNSLISPSKNNPSLGIAPIPSNSTTNFILVETFSTEENFLINENLNFVYLIVISTKDRTVDFFFKESNIKLSFGILNGLSDGNRNSPLELFFTNRIEDHIEDLGSHHSLNLISLNEKLELDHNYLTNSMKELESSLLIDDFSKEMKKFTLNKIHTVENSIEEIKRLFSAKDFHNNFISTNNTKLVKKLLEQGFKFYGPPNQIVQFKF